MTFSLSPFRRGVPRPTREAPARYRGSDEVLDVAALPPPHELASEPAAYVSTEPRRQPRYRDAVIAAAFLVATATITSLAAGGILATVIDTATWLHTRDSTLRRALVALPMLTLGALLVIRAWGRATAPERPIELAGGRGVIEPAQVAARLARSLEAHPNIQSATVRIENHHAAGVRVDVRAQVGPHARIDETLDAVDDAAEELLHHRLGVAMDGPPLVDVVYEALELRAGTAHD